MFKTFLRDSREFMGIVWEICRVLFLRAIGCYKAPKRRRKGNKPVGLKIPVAFL